MAKIIFSIFLVIFFIGSNAIPINNKVIQQVPVAVDDNGILLLSRPIVQELAHAQENLNNAISNALLSLEDVRNNLSSSRQSFENWEMSKIIDWCEEQVVYAQSYLLQALTYAQGANELLTVLQKLSKGVHVEWVEQVAKLIELGGLSTQRGNEALAQCVHHFNLMQGNLNAYEEAKSKQILITKDTMDTILALLAKKTLEVGQEAYKILREGLRQYESVLRRVIPAEADIAIAKINQAVAELSQDLLNLIPEDVDHAIADAHHSIDMIRSISFLHHVPSRDVRRSLNRLNSNIFTQLMIAKNYHGTLLAQFHDDGDDDEDYSSDYTI